MKSSVLTCLAVLICISLNAKDINAKLIRATVYQQGAALYHTANIVLNGGRQEVVITDLTPRLNPSSVRLQGFGEFVIHAVNHRLNSLRDPIAGKQFKIWKDSLETISDLLSGVNDRIWVLESEKSMILANKTSTGDGAAQLVLELQRKSDFYRSRLADILQQQSILSKKKLILEEQQKALQHQISQAGGIQKQVSEMVVDVEVLKPGNARFELSYLVHDAGWTPSYDLRADQVGNPVNLIYQGIVYQQTGYDWSDIQLSLSTHRPFQNSVKPVLHPWLLRFTSVHNAPASQSNRQFSMSKANAEGVAGSANDDLEAPPAAIATAITSESETGIHFDLTGKHTVANGTRGQTYRISQHDIPASYTHFASPKASRDVFLLARIFDYEKLNLVAGKARIFFENAYVGETYINPRQTSDTLDLSLGIDPGLVVERTRLKDFSESKILNSNRRETIAMEIKVRNARDKPISLLIEDQVPVSTQSEIEVEIKELSGARYEASVGKLMWQLILKPGETTSRQITYIVKYPKDRQINL